MRKAQGLSINTIIVAAIALIVLVVLIAIFTGRMGLFGRDLSGVQEGGICKSDNMQMVQGIGCDELGGDWHVIYSNFQKCEENEDPGVDGCHKSGYVCCSK